jgi:hypothetical protein
MNSLLPCLARSYVTTVLDYALSLSIAVSAVASYSLFNLPEQARDFLVMPTGRIHTVGLGEYSLDWI